MITVGTGQAEVIETHSVVRTALVQCRRQLNSVRPQAGIVFVGGHFDHHLMLGAIRRQYPVIELVGCTTAGDFSTSFGFSDDAITLMLFASDDVTIRAGVGRGLATDPAFLYDPDQDTFKELGGAGIALGIDAASDYTENRKKGIKDGQVLAIGTDGIWEAYSQDGRMFGKQRFRDILRRHAHTGADDILNAVYEDLSAFTIGRKSEDDITLVILKVNRNE
jgi:hypothetical protein